ncbi:replication initiation factor domain-containing protein [Hahella sp. HN01]|uniref:replication initiation factor domain-containing protein n=1 Tax=Hahella sp. HN01 TaxID=2847262 RepID=UPI001C1F1217|nr:replication initiation factor domain-containing protein [Hahella sp. HN01]MBU6955545.1 replication initiation factor domain-containing protein [Hahella sp. HN01]
MANQGGNPFSPGVHSFGSGTFLMLLRDHPACKPIECEAFIDTVSITFPLSYVSDFGDWGMNIDLHNIQDKDFWFIRALSRLIRFVFGRSIELEPTVRGPRNNFQHCIHFKGKAGFIAYGGNNIVRNGTGDEVGRRPERCQIYLDGQGCAMVNKFPQLWQRVKTFFEAREGRLTRLDIAADLHDGRYGVNDAREWFAAGLFNGQGAPVKKCKFIDDCGTNDGCTFYVGSRKSGKMFRGYEKGKQLGDPTSPWNRFEVEMTSEGRVIPFDALVRPKDYLAGTYKALSWVSSTQEVVKTMQKKCAIEYEKAVAYARLAYGKLLHYMQDALGMTPDQVFFEIRRTDDQQPYPARLQLYADHDEVEPPEIDPTLPEDRGRPVVTRYQDTHAHLFASRADGVPSPSLAKAIADLQIDREISVGRYEI